MAKVPLQESLFSDLKDDRKKIERIERVLATLSTVAGEVRGDGVITRGTGFTVVRAAAGNYDVTFDDPFDQPPIVVLGVGPVPEISVRLSTAVPVSASGFRAIVFTPNSLPGIVQDGDFTFIATSSE